MNYTDFNLKSTANSQGYSLIELVVVLFVMGVLASIAIPPFLSWITLGKIDETKSLLNSAASECIQKIRTGSSPGDIKPAESFNGISEDRVSPLGYKIKTNSNSCSNFVLEPKDSSDALRYTLGFKINSNGELTKFAIPANNQASLNSCKLWAGSNCGITPEQQAEWDRLAKVEADKKLCNDSFYNWKNKPSSGQGTRWDEKTNTCSLQTWVFEGNVQPDEESFNQARELKYKESCDKKIKEVLASKTTGGPLVYPDCGIQEFFFVEGVQVASADEMKLKIAANQEKKCIADRESARLSNYNGKYGPISGPGSCGDVVWMCKGVQVGSEEEYKKLCPSPAPPPSPPTPPSPGGGGSPTCTPIMKLLGIC